MRNGTALIGAFSKILGFVLLLASGYACSRAQGGASAGGGQVWVVSTAAGSAQPPPGNTIAPGSASVIVIQGRVASVDQEKKLVTMEASGGKQVTLHVYNPDNLAAAKPGEPFIAKFFEVAAVEKLAPAQSPPARSLAAGIVNATPGQTPSAMFASQYQFAVTVDAISKNDKTISIKGSDGVIESIEIANPESLDQIQAGEQIVVTLTDVVAISLDAEADGSTLPVAAPLIHDPSSTHS